MGRGVALSPNAGTSECIHCTILHNVMALGSTQVRWRVREAVHHLHRLPYAWFTKPVYKSPELCVFRQVALPETRAKIVGKSDWEVVQRAFAPYHNILYPNAGEQGCYPPFDMPMAHIECHDDYTTTRQRLRTPSWWSSERHMLPRREHSSGRGLGGITWIVL